MYSPLAQFDVIRIIPIYIGNVEMSLTNLSLTVFAGISLIIVFFYFVMNSSKLVPNGWQLFIEQIFVFVYRLVFQQMGKKGIVYYPFIFSLFLFILILNLLGLVPFSFAATSHVIVTLYFSLSICLGVFFTGLVRFQVKFLKLFVPNVPLLLYPLMIPIEIISYIIRSFSLAIRLSANIMAGHTLVHILAEFTSLLFKVNKLLFVIPFLLLMAILVLELGVACLQAYVFVLLVCMYLNDSLYLVSH